MAPLIRDMYCSLKNEDSLIQFQIKKKLTILLLLEMIQTKPSKRPSQILYWLFFKRLFYWKMAEFPNRILKYGSQWKASYFSDRVTVLGPITVVFGWHFSIKNTNLKALVFFCKTILLQQSSLYMHKFKILFFFNKGTFRFCKKSISTYCDKILRLDTLKGHNMQVKK